MKLTRKRLSLLILILTIFCYAMPYPLNYWSGYYGWNTFPITFSLPAIGLFLVLLQVLIWVGSLRKKAYRAWTTLILIILLALPVFRSILPFSPILTMYGMRNRIMRDYSPDNLRRLAQDFDRLPKLPGDWPIKLYRNEDLVKTRLLEKYPFLMLFKSSYNTGPDSIAEQDGVVFVNGSRGQGGISIEMSINGGKISAPETGDPFLRVSEDIVFSVNEFEQ